MTVNIVTVDSKARLREFVRFPERLYRGCDNWVPALEGDEFDTFNPKKNDAYSYCEAECYLAYKDGRTVGRVAAIINHKANDTWGIDAVRFGWLDFVEDQEVLDALLDAVVRWGKARGCKVLKGPLGFTDMDKEGSLVEGYEHLSPFTCLYNYPYYDVMLKHYGLEKDVDWTQSVVHVEEDNYPPMFNYADIVERRYGLHMATSRSVGEFRRLYGMELFHLYNDTFAPLFQFCPLSDKQINNYLDTYVPILNRDFVGICLNAEEKPVGFAFCVPTLSKAVKKSRGKLFPFGFLRILRAIRKNDTLEALMIGILPEYQGKGASVLIFKYLHDNCLKYGIKRMILNPQLEENFKVQSLFEQYRTEPFMRRRAYCKGL